MLLVFPIAAPRQGPRPDGRRATSVESILQFLREQVARPVLHEATDRFMPFLWTVFFLILFANLLGALPITPLAHGRSRATPTTSAGTATGDISITLGLALCAFFAIHVGGIMEQGVRPLLQELRRRTCPWPLLLAAACPSRSSARSSSRSRSASVSSRT